MKKNEWEWMENIDEEKTLKSIHYLMHRTNPGSTKTFYTAWQSTTNVYQNLYHNWMHLSIWGYKFYRDYFSCQNS